MTSSSVLLLEIGKGQAAEVRRISASSCVEIVDVREDLAGIERCLVGRLRSSTG
jgi:methylase of polypeptide subunit release factors